MPNELAELFNNAFGRIATPEKAINGFRVTGIFPVNPEVFSDDDFLPAKNLQSNLPNEQEPEPEEAHDEHRTGSAGGSDNEEADMRNNADESVITSFSDLIPVPIRQPESGRKR